MALKKRKNKPPRQRRPRVVGWEPVIEYRYDYPGREGFSTPVVVGGLPVTEDMLVPPPPKPKPKKRKVKWW